jgi:hypothetical protein
MTQVRKFVPVAHEYNYGVPKYFPSFYFFQHSVSVTGFRLRLQAKSYYRHEQLYITYVTSLDLEYIRGLENLNMSVLSWLSLSVIYLKKDK